MAKKILKGTVVSTKMQKTVVVSVDISRMHPFYSKRVTKSKRFKARDDIGVNEGDVVEIEESRPYGKTVSWVVSKVLEEVSE